LTKSFVDILLCKHRLLTSLPRRGKMQIWNRSKITVKYTLRRSCGRQPKCKFRYFYRSSERILWQFFTTVLCNILYNDL